MGVLTINMSPNEFQDIKAERGAVSRPVTYLSRIRTLSGKQKNGYIDVYPTK